MGNKQDGNSKHGIKDETILNDKDCKSLGVTNINIPKFIRDNNPAPQDMKMEKITVEYCVYLRLYDKYLNALCILDRYHMKQTRINGVYW